MSDELSTGVVQCERCGTEVEKTKTITCEGRMWGQFCYDCHDVLAEVAMGETA